MRPLLYMLGKKQLRIFQRSKGHTWNHEISKGKHSKTLIKAKIFLNKIPQSQTVKAKINKWDYFKLKRFCIAKEKNQHDEDTIYRMRKCLQITNKMKE